MQWFDVDKQGLAKLLERRGKSFALMELIQNSWDTNAKKVVVNFEPLPGVPMSKIEVIDDDPNGFAHLSHAFTLFAESVKKGDAEKRGRFNLGEKLVLALCQEASIESTTGSVLFNAEGRHQRRYKLERGSRFCGVIRMTREEHAEALRMVHTLIPPANVETLVNGIALAKRTPVAVVEASLPTEVADEEGVLRRSVRKTTVRVYEAQPDEVPSVYELGIPVVETGDRWHVDVAQKVPLNFDRDNLPPAYLRALRVLVLNAMHDRLTKDDANATWVRDAGSDKNAAPEAMATVIDLRFGEKRVIYDPNDPEANSLAVTKGYTVIHGGMLNAEEWQNVKRAGAALPAGQVTPSPKPFHPGGEPLKVLAPDQWTPAIRRVATFARKAGHELVGYPITVEIANDIEWGFAAAYTKGHLTLNLGRLGHQWFEAWPDNSDVESLLIHEFAHHFEANHLSEGYHDALCDLGAKLTKLARTNPDFWG